jgi:hypothetical protein
VVLRCQIEGLLDRELSHAAATNIGRTLFSCKKSS